MMSRLKNISLVVLSLYSLTTTIILCNRKSAGYSDSEKLTAEVYNHYIPPDTNFGKVKVPEPLKLEVAPSTVTLSPDLKGKTNNVRENESSRDSVTAVELNANHFKFTFTTSTGSTSQKDFKIDTQNYRYVWVNNHLTATRIPSWKKFKFKTYLGGTYRPINNLTDVEAGVKLKGEHLTYKVGIQGFYYPKFQANPGWDVTIGIQYEF